VLELLGKPWSVNAPAKENFEWLPELDFAVLAHGFTPHGRDYIFIIEEGLGINPGQHELIFTHCVCLNYETRVRDDVWPTSWQDDFLEYK
jgi:hypothetical protein